jgi:hypothetical protein
MKTKIFTLALFAAVLFSACEDQTTPELVDVTGTWISTLHFTDADFNLEITLTQYGNGSISGTINDVEILGSYLDGNIVLQYKTQEIYTALLTGNATNNKLEGDYYVEGQHIAGWSAVRK